ncbi:MAG TPA: hypothetical protein VFK13_15595 [Gemmatimonadaceae bacterium]|nr:hypothetical protein [Gemmatimonadaceae bacterium]
MSAPHVFRDALLMFIADVMRGLWRSLKAELRQRRNGEEDHEPAVE